MEEAALLMRSSPVAAMTHVEKFLYHQIHPLKLLTDVATSFASSWLLWEAQWARAAVVAFVPSILISALLLWRADLERYKHTLLGRYLATFMTRKVEGIRLGGQVVMWAGAATHVPWLMPLGFMIIVFAWLKGFWAPVR
jgi:hypothetical protein